tara:strand:- start:143 stop:463 length:321 start_codon:yes stop_codon:yes gene_type:complete
MRWLDMKLYTDSEGNWRGTQAEARQEFNKWSVVEVPTNKVDLLIFLNDFDVGEVDLEPKFFPERPKSAIVSPIDESNLKTAFEQAGAAREALRRVFEKLKELEEVH